MPIEIIDLTDSPDSPPSSPRPSSNAPMILNFADVSVNHDNLHHINHDQSLAVVPMNPNNVNHVHRHQSLDVVPANPKNLDHILHHHQSFAAVAVDPNNLRHIYNHQSFDFVPVNPNNLHHIQHHQPTLWPAPELAAHTYHPSHIAPSFHPGRVTTILEPVPQLNAFMFPHGATLGHPWTQKEHELLLMGLKKFGRGRWHKIAKHFVRSKTPEQVESYANSFFKHLPPAYMYCFIKKRKPTITKINYSAANHMSRNNRNLMYSMPMNMIANAAPAMIANEAPAQETLTLFPENAPFSMAAPYGASTSSSNNINGYGFQMMTGGTSTSVTAGGNGEVDLELRLG